jgi:HAD superfamily phosphoserine phosphatase-like hydrolase
LIFLFKHSKQDVKELFFENFKNIKLSDFQNFCDEFSRNQIEKIIKKSFMDYICKIEKQNEIVIVSASISNYLKPWCRKLNFKLISTKLMVSEGLVTGKFDGENCNGIHKLIKIREKYKLEEYDQIHVFGNSEGDREMLNISTHKYFKYFK